MTLLTEDVIKLLVAVLIGGLIGAEREYRDKAAGFRTIIFICVGATLFTLFSIKLGGDGDPVRIAANIVSGVGFLGAGAIMRDAGRVMGLTTAATIWLAAALGMGVGGGHYLLASAAAVTVLVVLLIFPKIEFWIDNIRDVRVYEAVCTSSREKFEELEALFPENGLRVVNRKRIKSGEDMICTWHVYGMPKKHEAVLEEFFERADVKEFRV